MCERRQPTWALENGQQVGVKRLEVRASEARGRYDRGRGRYVRRRDLLFISTGGHFVEVIILHHPRKPVR